MVVTWIVPELGNNYFTEPFENMLIQYIYDEWSIADPQKGASMQTSESDIVFRPGYLAEQPTYQVLAIQRQTEPVGDNPLMISRTALSLMTTCEVLLRMKRLVSANADEDEMQLGIDPQLWNMEQEVLRIVGQYGKNPQDIAGIKNMLYLGHQRLDEPNPTWSKSEWRTLFRIGLWYEVRDVS